MSQSKNLGIRDSRDRLIDLLGLGETYPLCDVGVTEELKVPFNTNARLVVNPSQEAVHYQLRDNMGDGPSQRRDQPLERIEDNVAVPVAADGNGGNLELLTPVIEEDVTFTIFAAKHHPVRDGADSLRSVILHQRVRIKVGLDISLSSRISVTGDTELLDHQAATDGDARLIHYNGVVEVVVDGAQEGVDYELVSIDSEDNETLRCTTEVRGLGEGTIITLQSTPIAEDVDLRIRATKKFNVAENRGTEIVLLSAILPVRVRANTEVVATATAVVAYGAASQVRIAATQTSATYQLFARPIRDRDFARQGGVERFEIPVPGEAAVPIARPTWARVWETPAQMVAVGEPVAGNGGALVLALGELTHDTMVVVRVAKQHSTAAAQPALIASAIQLATATATLVAPNKTPAIELRVTMFNGATTGSVEVIGGQPGVLYYLRASADGEDLGPPAYVHQVDDTNPTENKGVGQLGVGVDLVVARSRVGIVSGQPQRLRPLNPVIPTPVLEAGQRLYLHAVVAQTRVHAALTNTAELTAVPKIANERVGVDTGTPARIEVTSSPAGDSYQLWLHDNPVGEPQVGTNNLLVLTSEPVETDTSFVVLVSPAQDRGIPVHRAVDVSVPLRPQTSLRTRIVAAEILGSGDQATRLISHAKPVKVEIRTTQKDVDYRLVELDDGESSVSQTVRGNGGNLVLTSQPLNEDATLRVRAIRRFYGVEDELAEPRQLLDASMPVAVRANPSLAVDVGPQAIVDYNASPLLALSGTQKSVTYSVFTRGVADAMRIFAGDEVPGELLEVVVGEGKPAVRVTRPVKTELWADLEGFVRRGDPVAGTGGDLSLALGQVTADTLVLVRADKQHAAAPATAVQLAGAQLVLARPNPTPELTLAIAGIGEQAGASVDIRGGESGVLYQLLDDQGIELAQPMYIHEGAENSEALGRGIGALRLDVELAVARARDEVYDSASETTQVLAPRVEGLTLATGDKLKIQAKRALTGVEAPLTGTAAIVAVPEIAATETTVAAGEGTTIVVNTSIAGQRYQLFHRGEPLSEAITGDGENLTFETGEIAASTTLVVEVSQIGTEGLEFVQRVALAIAVSSG